MNATLRDQDQRKRDLSQQLFIEHPEDVLSFLLEWRTQQPVALVAVAQTSGGGVRAPGALMVVREDGAAAGYVSGGCIDADVIAQAKTALQEKTIKRLRYGAGSSFIDIQLPCGGAIDVVIIPEPNKRAIEACHASLAGRRTARLALSDADLRFTYAPKLRLRIAGRGPEPIALARIASAAGLHVQLQLRDGKDADAALAAGQNGVTRLETPTSLPTVDDDPWTAFALMFHDPDWEEALLRQALGGAAFYIGAVGGRATHALRCERLRHVGVSESDLRRIHGPVGLIPAMRDASMLAVSTFAEIVANYHAEAQAPFQRTALILLAAGAGARFTGGDKLLAPYANGRVLDYPAAQLANDTLGARIAVVTPEAPARIQLLEAAGWRVILNHQAHTGIASSLRCGVRAVHENPNIDAALITLGDMPAVPEAHLRALQRAIGNGANAAMTEAHGVLTPPAAFSRSAFEALLTLDGDSGARGVFERLRDTAIVQLDPSLAFDIDTETDLATASR